ncbi:MAG: right-handed parallel beta-helix repeat-containing protein [Candidatus Pacebacteria bacterium]|nr:right-handed parallel beta-helix repeat-containing protein [Candidatus Paceibacterota bacterium]
MTSIPAGVRGGGSLTYTGGDYLFAYQGDSSAFWRYSISSDSWTSMAAAPAYMGGDYNDSDSLTYTGGDYIYSIGQLGTTGFYRYSISSNTWSTMSSTPVSMSDGTAISYTGDYLYALRGGSTTGFYRYSLGTDTGYDNQNNSGLMLRDNVVAEDSISFVSKISTGSAFTMTGTTTGTALTVIQSGTGNIVDFKDGAASVFTISDGGNIMMTGNLTTSSINNILYVDGTTYAQNSTGIQAAIDDLPSTGGKIILPEGTYPINNAMTFSKSNITLEGSGKSTIIRLIDGYDADINLLTDTGHSGIIISNLAIDGNYANQSSGSVHVIVLSSTTTNARVENCWISGATSSRSGIESYASSTVIEGCTFFNNYSNSTGLHIAGGQDNVISNNIFTGPSYLIYVQNSNNITISGNSFYSGDIRFWNSTNNTITGNKFRSSYLYFRSSSNNSTITGNFINTSGSYGIWMEASSYNSISANAIDGATVAGIYLSSASSYNNINGNNIQTTGTYGVQEAAATEDYNVVNGNTIVGSTISPVSAIGIHTTVSGNKTSDATEGLFDIVANVDATQSVLSLTQNGTGKIVSANDGSSEVFYVDNKGDIYNAQFKKDVWSEMADVPETVGHGGDLAAYTGGDYIYALRGYYTTDFYRYSISDNLWAAMASAPGTIYTGSLTYTGNDYLYALKGGGSGAFYRYSISENSWTTLTVVPVKVYGGGALEYTGSDYMYALVGNGTTDFYRYSISGNSWVSMADAPGAIDFGGSLAYTGGDYIYATRGNSTADFYRYSISNNSWDTMASTLSNFGYGTSLVYTDGDYLYATRGGGNLSVYRYSISVDYWKTINPAPNFFGHGGSLIYANGFIYALRGGYSTDFYRYSPGSDSNFGVQNNNGLMLRDNVVAEESISFVSKISTGNAFTMSGTIDGTLLTVTQSGTGNIVDFKDGSTSVFTITDGGNIVMSGNFNAPSINNIIYVDGAKYTQDSAGIQEAIDDLPSTGGKVIFPAATYNVDKAIDTAIADDGGSYTDETTEANESTTNDMALLPAAPAVDDVYYFGYDYRTRKVTLNISTAGVGTYTITWEYYDGSTWTALSGVTDGTTGFTVAGTNDITYTLPTDWAKTTINSTEKYYIRAKVSAFTSITTQPLGAQAYGHGSIIIDKSNVTLEGVGEASEIYMTDNTAVTGIFVNNSLVSLTNISISNLKIDGNYANNSGGLGGIYFNNVTESTIDGVYLYHTFRDGIYILSSYNNTVSNSYINDCGSGYGGLELYGVSDTLVTGNHFESSSYEAISVFGASRLKIIENNIETSDKDGMYLYNVNNSIISNNVFQDNRWDGIRADDTFNYNTIDGNTFLNNGQNATDTYSDINLSHGYYNVISNNNIRASATNKTKYGIYEASGVDVDYSIVESNTITGTVTAAIYAQGPHTTVSGNKTSDTAEGIFDIVANADATQTALKVTQNGTGNIIDFKDGATSVFTISDGGDIMMTGNLTTSSINNILYVDGTTYAQNSTGIQAAIDALPAEGGKVVLPAGTYNITATITITKSNVTLEGVGESTILYLADGTDVTMVMVGDGSNPYSNINIFNMKIDGNKANNSGSIYGIYFNGNITNSRIEDNYIHNIDNDAVIIERGSENTVKDNEISSAGYDAILVLSSGKNNIESNHIVDSSTCGINIGGYGSNYNVVLGNYISGSGLTSVSGFGIYVWRGTNNVVSSNVLYLNQRNGIVTYDTTYNTITANTITNSSQASNDVYSDIYLQSNTGVGAYSKYNLVSGNTIYASAVNKSKYGIQESEVGSDYNTIQNNVINGSVSGAIYALGIHSTISGNKTSSTTEGLFDIVANSGATQPALQVTQNGTGNIVDFKDSATSVFTISDGGNVVMTGRTFEQVAVDPVLKGSLIDSTYMDRPKSVYISGQYAYVASYFSDSLAVIDISNPTTPTLVGHLVDSTYMDGAYAVYVSGQYAFVTGGISDSLAVIDISNPTTPTLVGHLVDSTYMDVPYSVYISGKFAYVSGTGSDSLAIVDISNPTNPIIVGHFIDSTYMDVPYAVSLYGKYAYVVSYTSDSLAIIDISDPSNLTLTGYLVNSTYMDGAISVSISGKYAYIIGGNRGSLAIVNISNPAAPIIAGYFVNSAYISWDSTVSISGKYAYITGENSDSFAIVDISNPTTPTLVGHLVDSTYMNYASAVYVSGKYAYVTGSDSDSLAILDISGFDIPTANIGDLSVSTIDIVDNASVGNNLYVGNGLNVGPGGIFSDGPLAGYVSSEIAALTISQDGNGDLVDFRRSGTSIFKVGQATVEITQPLDLQVEGDVGIEYNLEFMNTSTSYIHSAGPFVISAGDSNSYENLTLTTSGTGDVIIDIANSLSGMRVVGANAKVFSIDGNGNVVIGGVDSSDADLIVKRNISTQGGNLTLNSLAIPANVAVAVVGTAGVTTYGYRVSAINGNGETIASTTVEVTTGNATLTTSAYNRITWSAVAGATGYKIYGRTSGSELYMATIDVPTLYYSDTGAVVTPAGALPTTNTTGGSISYPNSGGPVRSLILTPSGATIPTSDGASQVKIDGANHTYYVLDFDDSADESAYWHWTMPDSYDGGTIDVTYYWETTATTGDTIWCFQTVGIEPNNSEDIDTALSTAICETDTAQADANDLASVTESLAASGFVAGDYVAFKVYRDADDGSDTLVGDARLVKIKVEYHVNSESD